MKNLKIDVLVEEAHELWLKGNAYEVGELLYEHIRVADRPTWAAAILSAVSGKLCFSVSEIDELLKLSATPARWPDAMAVFDSLRELTLKGIQARKLGQDNEQYRILLHLAENVAKVIYNSSGQGAPFAHDAGWIVVAAAAGNAEVLGDTAFSDLIWKVASSREFVTSAGKVGMCNPHCTPCSRELRGVARPVGN